MDTIAKGLGGTFRCDNKLTATPPDVLPNRALTAGY